MQNSSISFLIGYTKSQLLTVENIFARLSIIAPTDQDKTDALAYQIHNYYSSIEDIFKEIQRIFEPDTRLEIVNYHKELLKHMVVELPDIRPRIISEAEYKFLEEILRFRHLFRHAYNYQLDPKKVHELKVLVIQNNQTLVQNIKDFIEIIKTNF